MAKIPVGEVPTIVRQVSTVMDGTGVPEKSSVAYVPTVAGKGTMIYVNPSVDDDFVGTSKGGLFEFEGQAQVRELFASCGAGATVTLSVEDTSEIKGPVRSYTVISAQDANNKFISLGNTVTVLPGQHLKAVVTGGSGDKLIGVTVLKYPG
jgi:hypothetical protein